MIVTGWDVQFGKWTDDVKLENRPKLVKGFFQYYAVKRKLKDNVICTFTGKLMVKHNFFSGFKKLSTISKQQRLKFSTFESKINSNFEQQYGLVVQDPFDLVFNLTKNITGSVLTEFCDLCTQSASLVKYKPRHIV